MFCSSVVAPGRSVPVAHRMCGRLKSLQSTMSGDGEGSPARAFLISSRAWVNSALVERFPPMELSGCRYSTMITKF